MLTRDQLLEVVDALTISQQQGTLHWYVSPGLDSEDAFRLDLTDSYLVEVGRKSETGKLFIQMSLSNGKRLGQLTASEGDDHFAQLESLYLGAEQYATQLVVGDIKRSIGESARFGQVQILQTPPPIPQPPTDEEARTFFDRIKGRWRFESRGERQEVEVDEAGNYFLLPRVDAPPFAQALRKHVYRLVLQSYKPAIDAVEFSKQDLSGRTRQIEVLHIGSDVIDGVVKHDGSKVKYTRVR